MFGRGSFQSLAGPRHERKKFHGARDATASSTHPNGRLLCPSSRLGTLRDIRHLPHLQFKVSNTIATTEVTHLADVTGVADVTDVTDMTDRSSPTEACPPACVGLARYLLGFH